MADPDWRPVTNLRQKLLDQQALFRRHPFFAEVTAASLKHFAPRMTFWVFTFQDLLVLNEARIDDPRLRNLARHHRLEDVGHERWFVDDLRALGLELPTAGALFSADLAPIREATFRIVSQSVGPRSSLERVVLLLVLESAGHVFFEEMARGLPANPGAPRLRYFSDFHLQVEKAHEVFERKTEALIDSLLADAEWPAACAMIDQVFGAFTTLLDALRVDPAARSP